MNYQEHYNRLIRRAKEREITTYTEKHHILPKCLGGNDEKENLVRLTGREHFIAHLLLLKIYPTEFGLIKAVQMMCMASDNQNRINNRMYSWLKEKHKQHMSFLQQGEKNSQYGTKWIHNIKTNENKKLKANETLPIGFVFGKYKKPKVEKKNCKKEFDYKLYNYYYKIYNENGFKKFVEITGYMYTKQNLVQRFKKLPNFKSQNGKKRGKE